MTVKKPVNLEKVIADIYDHFEEVYNVDSNAASVLLYQCLKSLDIRSSMLEHIDSLVKDGYLTKFKSICIDKK